MAYTPNATELVYNYICGKIQNFEWREGDKIWTEHQFCSELGVSRVSVRQAIDKLVATSTLRKVQGSGTYVQDSNPLTLINVPTQVITDVNLLDIIRFRIYFDSSNVEQFIHSATAAEFDRLQKVHESMMLCSPQSEDFFKYDYEFHHIIAAGTKNSYIEQIYVLLADTLIKNQERLHKIIGPNIALEHHPVIMHYIFKRDAQVASLMMRRHLEETALQFEGYMLKKADAEQEFAH